MSPTFEQLLNGDVYTTSLINEPFDFVVEEPKAESAAERARRRWFNREEDRAR